MTTQHNSAVLERETQAAQLKLRTMDCNFYGMHVFQVGSSEFITGTIAQAELSVQKLLADCLDLVDADMILKYSNLPPEAKSTVQWVQEWFSAAIDAPPPLATVITDMAALAKEAIATYGRLHLWTLGRTANHVEHRLSEFPGEVQKFILQELGCPEGDPQEVVMYTWA